MSRNAARRAAVLGASSALLCLAAALSGCASTTSGGVVGEPGPTVTVTTTAGGSGGSGGSGNTGGSGGGATSVPPAVPANYFADGKTYDAWVISINSDGTLTIGLVHHLTGNDAKNYLTSHGQTIGPDGIPNDYINVDTYVHRNVKFSTTATVTTNPQGLAQPMSAGKFLSTYLPQNLAQPIAASDQDHYAGAPHYYGALYALKFHNDTITSVDQIFEP